MELKNLSPYLFPSQGPSRTPHAYLSKLEKHLSDYRSGNGNLASEAPEVIHQQMYASSSFLASSNPKASRSLTGYLTALPYTQRARFINGVDSAVQMVGAIEGLYKIA